MTGERDVFSRARTAMCGARENEFAVLEIVAEIDVAGTGYPSTERLVEDLFHIDRRDARRFVRHAAALLPGRALSGEPVPPRAPATAAVHAGGEVGPAHVDVVLDALDRLAHVSVPVLAEAEATLAEAATYLPPRALAKVAARLVATLDPDGVAPADDADPVDELHLGSRREGPLNGRFRFHRGADRELIREVLDALSTPAGPEDPRSLATRQAEAFLDLVARAASPTGVATPPGHEPAAGAEPPTDADGDQDGDQDGDRDADRDADGGAEDGRGTSAGPRAGAPLRPLGRALLTLTMDLQWLREHTGHGTLDSETAIGPAEARRLACDSGIVPLVLGARSEPLDVGRLTYTVPEGIRRALIVRDGGCAFPGCTRRPARCAAHHIRHWVDGGPTALHNLALLCRYHHGLVHRDHWCVRMVEGRPWFIPPRWLDPDRTPRPGGRSPRPPALQLT